MLPRASHNHTLMGRLACRFDRPVPGLRWQALGHVAELRTLGASLAGEPSDQMAAQCGSRMASGFL
jgi:hypothetical protein